MPLLWQDERCGHHCLHTSHLNVHKKRFPQSLLKPQNSNFVIHEHRQALPSRAPLASVICGHIVSFTRFIGSICKIHERTTWIVLTTASSSFRYEKNYGDHEDAEGIKICGMTVVICLYARLQCVYRLVEIVVAAPIVYTAVLF